MERLYTYLMKFIQKAHQKVMKTGRFKLNFTKLIQFGTTVYTFTFLSVIDIAGAMPIPMPTAVNYAQSLPPSGFSPYPASKISPLDGIWKLQWRMNGKSFDGLLTLMGNSGTMTVNVRYSNGQNDVVQQRMVVQSSGDQFILSGQDPVYAGTNMPIVSYIADTFLIEQAANLEGWRARSCDSTERCSRVTMQYVDPAYPASVPNRTPAEMPTKWDSL
ncbi:hypothetical protein [Nostoc sp. DedQUE09]|uniref:hypothetical protein n=1 Tax=Nostoc sp. DedQUE09 TaxID=3075394 RepID=UPI002AD24ED6|nr:hypothetical protein [Nostoc sp. DedQUE09]MDZ7951177.1 hypothetical protein [Nostoc sp. DedQUE09]